MHLIGFIIKKRFLSVFRPGFCIKWLLNLASRHKILNLLTNDANVTLIIIIIIIIIIINVNNMKKLLTT